MALDSCARSAQASLYGPVQRYPGDLCVLACKLLRLNGSDTGFCANAEAWPSSSCRGASVPTAITTVQWKAGHQSKGLDAAPGKMPIAEHGSP